MTAAMSHTKREKILVLLNSDGFVECFASKDVDVHITNVPHVSTPAAEILVEEYIELTIPRSYRDVYWPSYRRAVEQIRHTTPADIMQRQSDVELLRGLQGKCDDRNGGRKRWMF